MTRDGWLLVATFGWVLSLIFAYGAIAYVIDESRAWRHLVQLYCEARLRKQLPVDPGPNSEVSSLSLPKDLQQQLAARDIEKHQ